MERQLKISVITPVLNAVAEIGRTLDSVAGQDFADIEHVIVDGCSIDGTLDVVRERGARVAFVDSRKDSGVYDALNRGIDLSSGDAILVLHAGDTYLAPDAISGIADALSDDDIDMVFADAVMVHPVHRHRVVRALPARSFRADHLLRGLMPAHPAMAFRRRVHERFGKYATSYPIAGDFDFCLRTLYQGKIRYQYHEKCLVEMPAGGLSNRHWYSPFLNTLEMRRVCQANGVPASLPRLASRLVVKWWSR